MAVPDAVKETAEPETVAGPSANGQTVAPNRHSPSAAMEPSDILIKVKWPVPALSVVSPSHVSVATTEPLSSLSLHPKPRKQANGMEIIKADTGIDLIDVSLCLCPLLPLQSP